MQGTAKGGRRIVGMGKRASALQNPFLYPLLEKGKERRNVAGWEKEEERRDVSDMGIL